MTSIMVNILPFWVDTSSPFCNLEVGDVFQERDGLYRLLYRDMVKVRVVKLNWWTVCGRRKYQWPNPWRRR